MSGLLTGLCSVPNNVIYGIAYNTTDYGYAAIENSACNFSSAGCGYDSLNVAVAGVLSVGINPAPNDAYFNSLFGGFYCNGGVGGTGTFRLDAGCWTGFKPAVKFNAARPVTNKDQCKNGGWQTYTRADGSTFRNQGDCVSYVNTGR